MWTLGTSKSKHLPRQPPDYNYITDNHPSTRKEKYDLFLAIRDDPEERVIKFMKKNPWTLSCMFWFETYAYKEGKIIEKVFHCSCTQDLELCMKTNVCKQEMLKRLEISIACGMCPHVIFDKKGLNVTYDQDIEACDVLNNFNLTDISNRSVRHACKYHGGIFWIQLAIVFGKVKLITDILPFCIDCNIKTEAMLSVHHYISPLVLSVLHQETAIVESIASTYPGLVGYYNHGSAPVKDDSELALYYKELQLALQRGQFTDFKILFQYFRKAIYDQDNNSLWSMWIDKVKESYMAGNNDALRCLLSINNIDIYEYQYLFNYIYLSECYWIYTMTFEETDFLIQYVKNGKDKRYINVLDEMMIKAIFTGDSSVVKLFIDNGFNKDAMFYQCSALAWAEGLQYDGIVQVLTEANATATYHPYSYSMVFLVIDHRKAKEVLIDFNPLPIVHRLCENGHSLECAIDPLSTAWETDQNHVVKYLLLRGADPVNILKRWGSGVRRQQCQCARYFYHLIKANRFISIFKILGANNMISVRSDVSRLEIIDEVSDPGVNLSVEEYIVNKMPKQSDSLLAVVTQWCSKPRSLTSLCRRALRKHYQGLLYERFLRYVKHLVPKSTYSFLQLNDILSLISSSVDINALDKETAEVDEYF